MTADSVKAFLQAVPGCHPAVRSESYAGRVEGPGSGAIDKSGSKCGNYDRSRKGRRGVGHMQEGVDVSSKYKEKAIKLAEKLAHVPTLGLHRLT